MKHCIIYICLASIFFSCKSFVSTPGELTRYLNQPNNGIYKETEKKGIKIRAYIKPADLLIAQELRAHQFIKEKEIDSISRYYRKYLYMVVEFSKEGKPILQQVDSPKGYSELINTLSFQMNDYVYLASSTDTIRAHDYQLAQFYGMEIANTLLFSFPGEKIYKNREVDLIIEDFGINLHSTRFTFKTRDIKKIPHLNFKETDESYK